MAKQENLYVLIEKHCNAEQVRDLLRKYKDINKETKAEIHITGSKDEVIENLRRVVSKGLIPKDDPINLLRDCEENGQQHIFYFRAKNQSVRKHCKDFDDIVEKLIGYEWDASSFPRFDFVPDDYQWVGLSEGNFRKTTRLGAQSIRARTVFPKNRCKTPFRYRAGRVL